MSLIVLQNRLEMFYASIQEPEKGNIFAAEMKSIIDVLLVNAQTRKASKLRTLQEKNLLVELEDARDVTSQQFHSHVYGVAVLTVGSSSLGS
jgi:hypothetical protein